MRWIRALLVGLLTACLFSGCGDAEGAGNTGNMGNEANTGNTGNEAEEPVDTSALGGLEVGMSWLTKTVNKVKAGEDTLERVMFTRYEVLKIEQGTCTFKQSNLDAKKIVIDSVEDTYPKNITGSATDPVRPKISDETVEAAGRSFKCLKIESEGSTIWSSTEFPLVTVRSLVKADMLESETTLEEFNIGG